MHYLAWPMVEGETLDKVIEKHGKLSVEQAAGYALQAAEGLELCHRQNLFHGLLKPSNLMIGPDGGVRILDFGIGCLLAETEGESLVDTMSTANSVNSGLDCASPESIMDPTNLTPLGDQYSLGCVLYYCLTGRYPFPDGTAVEKMMCHQHKQPTPLKQLAPETPDEFVALVERLMQKNPPDRYADCGELMEALKPFAAVAAAPVRRTMSMPRVALPRPAAAPSAPTPAPPPPAVANTAPRPLPRPTLAPPRPPASAPPSPVSPVAPLGRLSQPRPLRPTPAPIAPMSRPEPVAQPVTEQELDEAPAPAEAADAPPVEQSMGTTGVVLMAVLAGVAAWLLSSLIRL
jgi:serine/threonine-protein kinase